jgi:hypothetical protein
LWTTVAAIVFPCQATIAADTKLWTICVVRNEDQGSVNLYPVQLIADGKLVGTFDSGGKTICFQPKGVGAVISLRWPAFDWRRPDHGLHSSAAAESEKVIAVKSNQAERSLNKKPLEICSSRVQGGSPFWHFVSKVEPCTG